MRRSPLAALFARFGATTVVQNTTIVAPNGQGGRVTDRWSCRDGVGPTAFPIRRRVEGSGLGGRVPSAFTTDSGGGRGERVGHAEIVEFGDRDAVAVLPRDLVCRLLLEKKNKEDLFE